MASQQLTNHTHSANHYDSPPNPSATTLQGRIRSTAGSVFNSVQSASEQAASTGLNLLDRVFPPEQREKALAWLHAFMLAHPKLSAFLTLQILFTGVPLVLFLLYSVTVFVSSMIIGLLLGLLGALTFTLASIGMAMLVVLPTLALTTTTACFLFLWGLGSFYFLRWAAGGEANLLGQGYDGEAAGKRIEVKKEK